MCCFEAFVFLWSLVNTMFLWNLQVDCLALQPTGTSVAIRFDKFEWVINDKFGRANEVYVSQYNGYDFLNLAMTFNFDFILQKLNVEFIKCKEHYVDCVNYRSFEVARLCGNEKALLLFAKIGYVNRELLCTIKNGSYTLKNVTINSENIVKSFALSFDKWWEKSWKWNAIAFSNDDSFVMRSNGQIRYLLLSNRKSSTDSRRRNISR
ncbi:uncharacterized protein LOC126897715 isoform X2 [Daktulosphaira vitifoliae]|nr:uncharacterized protein LOC126897715 isoform X2 [Daktulosphaira vitifoliae]